METGNFSSPFYFFANVLPLIELHQISSDNRGNSSTFEFATDERRMRALGVKIFRVDCPK